MAVVVDGPAGMNLEYDVVIEAPEEDEYIVARAIADFAPEEEGRFIALETNAPVFVFTKHISGWWTGECKGKYGLFPSNFVSEEFHVTLRPKAFDAASALALEAENREAVPSSVGTGDSSIEGSDDDTDSDSDDDTDELNYGLDEALNASSGSMPIAIPNSAHATPEKLPKLTLPSSDSFLLTDTSKLTPVSRQLGEFVDRLNESARTPPVSNPTTPTSALAMGSSPRFSTPTPPSVRRKSGTTRVTRTDSLGLPEDFDREKSKLTPVSKQLGEFVDRLNKSRTSVDMKESTLTRTKSSRNGEPIFNVFDGLLADIESLRNNPVDGEEWDDEDVYNTPEAARARIATDVKALRDELEQANNARITMESDIVRLREEYAARLELERKGRIVLEKRLSERELSTYPREAPTPYISVTPAINSQPIANDTIPLQQELEEYKTKNLILETEVEKLQHTIDTLRKESEDASKNTEKNTTVQDEVKILRAELESLRAQKDASNKNVEEQIRIAKEQVAREKDQFFIKEREHLVQQNNELLQIELRKLSEREEERTRIALDDRSKQLDAVIAAHEETRKRLESERDKAREGEAARIKELQELKEKHQKLKELPPQPKASEPKTASTLKIAEPKAPEGAHTPRTNLDLPKLTVVPEEPLQIDTHTATTPRATSPTNALTPPDAPFSKDTTTLRSTTPPTNTTPRSTTPPIKDTTPRNVAPPKDATTAPKDTLLSPRDAPSRSTPTMQRALSHDAVPASNRPSLRPLTTTDTQQSLEGGRKLAQAAPIRRTIATRPEEDNSLATNPLFQQKRLSTQVLEPIPTTFAVPATPTPTPTPTPSSTSTTSSTQQPQGPVLRRAASSLPSVPSV